MVLVTSKVIYGECVAVCVKLIFSMNKIGERIKPLFLICGFYLTVVILQLDIIVLCRVKPRFRPRGIFEIVECRGMTLAIKRDPPIDIRQYVKRR
jgi:hypothetical protein